MERWGGPRGIRAVLGILIAVALGACKGVTIRGITDDGAISATPTPAPTPPPVSAASALGWSEPSPYGALTVTAAWTRSADASLSNQRIQFYSDGTCGTPSGAQIDLASAIAQTRSFTAGAAGTFSYRIESLNAAGGSGLSACSSAMVIGAPSTIAFSRGFYTFDESGTLIGQAITVSRDIAGVAQAVTLTADAITAGGSDVTLGTQTVNFGVNATSVTVPVSSFSPVADTTLEGDEVFRIRLSSPTNNSQLGAITEAAVNLLDNERSGSFFFPVTLLSVSENAGALSGVIQRKGSGSPATVSVYTLGGSAVAVTDYTSPGAGISFAAGVDEMPLSIAVSDNAVAKDNRSFFVVLTAVGQGGTRDHSMAKARILDNDDTTVCDRNNDNLSVNSGFGGGAGTAGDPWRICSLPQLYRLRNDLSAHYRIMADLDLDPTLDADSGTGGIQPFTHVAGALSGTLNGDERVLRNFRETSSSSANASGFFDELGNSASAAIRALNLTQAVFHNSVSNSSSGGLVGRTTASMDTVSNCYFDGNVTVTGLGAAGGIVGSALATSANPYRYNLASGKWISSGSGAGGIVGSSEFANNLDTELNSCHSIGTAQGHNAGGLIGGTGNTSGSNYRIQNSNSYGTVLGASGSAFVGGLVGLMSGGTSDLRIQSSSSAATVYGYGSNTAGAIGRFLCYAGSQCDLNDLTVNGTVTHLGGAGTSAVGGIIGWLVDRTSMTITDCFAGGSLSTSGATGGNYVGGIIGFGEIDTASVALNITDATVGGSIVSTGAVGMVGGVAGNLEFTNVAVNNRSININSALSFASVSSASNNTGGLAGRLGAITSGTGNAFLITTSTASGSVTGNNYTGGLVGEIFLNGGSGTSATVTASNSSGAVNGINILGGLVARIDIQGLGTALVTQSRSTSNVTGEDQSGGLVGSISCQGSAGAKTVTVERSYSSGAVVGDAYTGGAIGRMVGYDATCTEQIVDSYSTGSVTGDNIVGGLVGYTQQASGAPVFNITRSFSRSIVAGNSNVEGLIGWTATGTVVTSSYWHRDTGINASLPTTDGRHRTTAQLQTTATFTGWDFTTIWNAPSSGVYPTLR